MLIYSTPNRRLSWTSLCANRRRISLSTFLTSIYKKERRGSTPFITTICFTVRNPFSSVFYSFIQPFSTYVWSISWWTFWVEDLMTYRDHIFVDFLPIYFLFQGKASPKEYPGSRLLLPIKYGLDWRKKNGNKIIMSVAPFHISCVIPRKSSLIVLYCELKWKKRDPGWKWRIRRRRHQLSKVTVGLSKLAIFTA